MHKFEIFNKIRFFDYKNDLFNQIHDEIQSEKDEFILQVDENKYINYLVEKYKFNLLTFHFDEESIEENNNVITYYLPFEGDEELLEFRPNPYTIHNIRIFLKNNCICFNIEYNDNEQIMRNNIDRNKEIIEENYNTLEKDVKNYNSSLPTKIASYFKSYKESIIQKKNNISSIGIPLKRKNNAQTYAVSTPEKKKILNIKPKISKNTILEPTVSNDDYNYILELIYNGGKNFETHPSTYMDKDEESLRDILIFMLAPHFEGSVTGETFNKNGKTDILLKYENTNVFVAECKFWRGIKSYYVAIDQLLSYLTWRDSKTALIIFVDNKEIMPVIEQIKDKTQEHENFIKADKPISDSWLNYTFHLNGDKNREIKIAILIFHIPK